MIILGLDPGNRFTGYGLVEKQGDRLTHIDNGVITCGEASSFDKRLVLIYNGIQELILKFNPHAVAIENIFYSKNVQSALKLGQARGSALVAVSQQQLPIFEYSPSVIKQAVVGHGHATKDQVQKMVKILLNLPQVAEENASDALAAAICHAHAEKWNNISAGRGGPVWPPVKEGQPHSAAVAKATLAKEARVAPTKK